MNEFFWLIDDLIECETRYWILALLVFQWMCDPHRRHDFDTISHSIDAKQRGRVRQHVRRKSTVDNRAEHVRSTREQTSSVGSASRIRYSLELCRWNIWRLDEIILCRSIRSSTYAKTATSRFKSRMLMNSMWKARRTCVAVASASLELVLFAKRSVHRKQKWLWCSSSTESRRNEPSNHFLSSTSP